jgi:hypothetical protein
MSTDRVGFHSSVLCQDPKMLDVASKLKRELRECEINISVIWGKEEASWRFYAWDAVNDLEYSPLVAEYMIVESDNSPREWSDLLAGDILDAFARGADEHKIVSDIRTFRDVKRAMASRGTPHKGSQRG